MKKVKLGECISEVSNKATKNNQYQVLSVTKDGIYSQADFFKKQIASKNNIGYKIVKKYNLVFSTMNLWMGSLDVLENYEIGIVSPAYKIFEFNENIMIPQFAKYFMKSHFMIERYKDCSEQGASVVRRNLDLKQLLKTNINLPDIEEQMLIANTLKDIDNIIKQLSKQIENKNKFITSQFVEMFGNERKNKRLDKICNYFRDGNWIESKDQSEDGIRLIQTGNIGEGEFKDKEEKFHFISEKTFKRLNCSEVKSGDILISRLPNPIGRACIVPSLNSKAITAVDCTIVRLNKNILNEYFVNFTKTNLYLSQIELFISGSTRKRISRNNLGSIKVPIASMKKQKEFSNIAKLIDKQKFELEKQEKNYELLKKGIIQKLIDEQQ